MSDLFLKLIELYINRKDKFVKAEERNTRRLEYFKTVKEVAENKEYSFELKTALLDSAAQKLTGSYKVNFEVVDYYYRHPDFINFEIVATHVWFWDESISKIYDENNTLVKLELDKVGYKKEVRNLYFSICFFIFAAIYFTVFSHSIINFLASKFYLSQTALGVVFIFILLVILGFTVFLLILLATLKDLPRLVK